MKINKKKALSIILCLLVLFASSCGKEEEQTSSEIFISEIHEEDNEKKPENITWEEFVAFSDEKKEAFFEGFDNAEEFNEWLDEAQSKDIIKDVPWENGGKKPWEYSWEEYVSLPNNQKDSFFDSFESAEEFNRWLEKAQNGEIESDIPWERGEKLPNEYTWEEYVALPENLKDAFFYSFETLEEFNDWLKRVQNEE